MLDAKSTLIKKKGMVKFTQPVFVRSLVAEFGAGTKSVSAPVPAGQSLQTTDDGDVTSDSVKEQIQGGIENCYA
jgi:hypothetical protein